MYCSQSYFHKKTGEKVGWQVFSWVLPCFVFLLFQWWHVNFLSRSHRVIYITHYSMLRHLQWEWVVFLGDLVVWSLFCLLTVLVIRSACRKATGHIATGMAMSSILLAGTGYLFLKELYGYLEIYFL